MGCGHTGVDAGLLAVDPGDAVAASVLHDRARNATPCGTRHNRNASVGT
jgi:hypothetical protein